MKILLSKSGNPMNSFTEYFHHQNLVIHFPINFSKGKKNKLFQGDNFMKKWKK